ncbi:hypothetical protein [Lusitaniella coriacea]|nr:hypothetical protein [Lusitaniella coriacea]
MVRNLGIIEYQFLQCAIADSEVFEEGARSFLEGDAIAELVISHW